LITFQLSSTFVGNWGNIENWLEPKTEPLLENFACLNPWNFLIIILHGQLVQRVWFIHRILNYCNFQSYILGPCINGVQCSIFLIKNCKFLPLLRKGNCYSRVSPVYHLFSKPILFTKDHFLSNHLYINMRNMYMSYFFSVTSVRFGASPLFNLGLLSDFLYCCFIIYFALLDVAI